MYNENNGMTKGVFIGLLTGAAVGSIITLLFAPESGNELRKDIKTKSQGFIGDIDQYILKAKDKVSQLILDSKKESDKMVVETKVKVDSLLNEAERLLNDAKNKTGNVVQQGKDKFEKESERLKYALKASMDA